MENMADFATNSELLKQIHSMVKSMQADYRHLTSAVNAIENRLNLLISPRPEADATGDSQHNTKEPIIFGLSDGERYDSSGTISLATVYIPT